AAAAVRAGVLHPLRAALRSRSARGLPAGGLRLLRRVSPLGRAADAGTDIPVPGLPAGVPRTPGRRVRAPALVAVDRRGESGLLAVLPGAGTAAAALRDRKS